MALHPASLCLRPGQGTGLSGPNGSGKSTLLKLLSQILPADSGEIYWDEKPVLGDRSFLRSTLGYVPQEDALLACTPAEQLLDLPLLQPVLVEGDFPADQGDHSVAAPKGERADFKKFSKQPPAQP